MPVFFFQSSSNHRDLHSFPTRRSSDLGSSPARAARARERLLALARGRRSIAASETRRGARRRLASRDARVRQDRKSTRLNSSHVAISYAVFCLKKKTKKKQIRDN